MHLDHIKTADLNLLVALGALLEERSVTRAAARVGITQSAMSRTLGRLRDLFDDPLFVRTGRLLAPTARAESLRGPLAALLEDTHALLSSPGPFDPATAERSFTVLTTDFVVALLVPALAVRLAVDAPGIDLVTVARRTEEARDALEDGTADVVIGPGFAPLTGPLGTRHLVREEFSCLLRADHPALSEPLTLARYAALPHLLIAPQATAGGVVDQLLAQHGLSRRVAVRVETFEVAPEIVAATDLICTLPRSVAQRASRRLPVAALDPPLPIPGFSMSLFWHQRQQHDPAHEWFRQTVTTTLRTELSTLR